MSSRNIIAIAIVAALGVSGYFAYRSAIDSSNASPPKPTLEISSLPARFPLPTTSRAPQSSNVASTGVRRAAGVVNMDASVPGAMTAREIRRLRSLADAGDATGAYQLYFLLKRCAHMADWIKGLRMAISNGLKRAPEVLEDAEAAMNDCKSVAPELIRKRTDYLDLAASRGDIRAQVEFGNHFPADLQTEDDLIRHPEKVAAFKAKRMSYLHAAAEQGAASAFAYLSGTYRDGVMAERDPVAALAYNLAWGEVAPKMDPTRSSRKYYEAGMTPEQINRAEELNRQIMARCCR